MTMTPVWTPGGWTAPLNATNYDRKFVENIPLNQISIPKRPAFTMHGGVTTKERAAG